jgi:hypothetical protein
MIKKAKKHLALRLFIDDKLSKKSLIIFCLIFACIAAILFLQSDAANNPNLPGDLNNNNSVDVTDLSLLLSNYGTTNIVADINGDGLVSVLDLSILLSNYGKTYTPTPPPPSQTVTFKPTQIPISNTEITNIYRGEYKWNGNSAYPTGWPINSTYNRYSWRSIEPTQGNYNWSNIDSLLSQAATMGGQAGFRIMTVCGGCGTVAVPDYIKSGAGGYSTSTSSGASYNGYWVPAWNNEFYLSRWDALMQAMAARYNNDKRLGWIDIGGYGNWSEWHLSGLGTVSGYPPATATTLKRLVDASVNNFTNKQLVINVVSADAGEYAWTRAAAGPNQPPVGIRWDCVGYGPGGLGFISGMDAIKNRGKVDPYQIWKRAPLITEWCNLVGNGVDEFVQGKSDVSTYHLALLSSGNFPNRSSLSSTQIANFQAANKASGYRVGIQQVVAPVTLSAGSSFSLTTNWTNVNVAPPYGKWQVKYRLQNSSSGTTVLTGNSVFDISKLQPTGTSFFASTDSFTVPAGTPAGTYNLSVGVVNQQPGTNYTLANMNLAITGRSGDGYYLLGQITVK